MFTQTNTVMLNNSLGVRRKDTPILPIPQPFATPEQREQLLNLASYEVYSDQDRRQLRATIHTLTQAAAAAMIDEMQSTVVLYCQSQFPAFCA